MSPVLATESAQKGWATSPVTRPSTLGLSWVAWAPRGLPLSSSLTAPALGRRTHSTAWSFWGKPALRRCDRAQGAQKHSQGSAASVTFTSTSCPPEPLGPPQATHPHLLSAWPGRGGHSPSWKAGGGSHLLLQHGPLAGLAGCGLVSPAAPPDPRGGLNKADASQHSPTAQLGQAPPSW